MKIQETISPYDFDTTLKRFKSHFPGEHFKIVFELLYHDMLQEKFPIEKKAVTIGICKPFLAQEVLLMDTAFAYLLPCRVVIREDNEGVVIGYSSMKDDMGLIGGPKSEVAAGQVEEWLDQIIEEVIAA